MKIGVGFNAPLVYGRPRQDRQRYYALMRRMARMGTGHKRMYGRPHASTVQAMRVYRSEFCVNRPKRKKRKGKAKRR